MTTNHLRRTQHLDNGEPYDSVPVVNFFVYPPLGRMVDRSKDIRELLGLDEPMEYSDSYVAYLSVPYCVSRCNSCLCFRELLPKTVERERFLEDYVDALVLQIKGYDHARRYREANCRAVFMGGGTATLLSVRQLERVIHALRSSLGLEEGAEITLEGNPTDLTPEYLAGVAELGVTRVSIGYQSGQENTLKTLGTVHNAAEGAAALKYAMESPIPHVNVDLLFDVPGQTFQEWQKDVHQIIDLNPHSVTIGDYTVFPKTRTALLINRGKLPRQTSVREVYQWYEWAGVTLAKAGFNEQVRQMFCQPGREQQYIEYSARKNTELLAFGSGAIGFINGVQFRNIDDSREYKRAMAAGEIFLCDQVSRRASQRNLMERFIIHNLYGSMVARDAFRQRFGSDVVEEFADIISRLVEDGLATVDDQAVRLTHLGRQWRRNVYYEFYSVRDARL